MLLLACSAVRLRPPRRIRGCERERLRHDPAMRWIVGGKERHLAEPDGPLRDKMARCGEEPIRPHRSPIFLANGLTAFMVVVHRRASSLTWIRA
jgi:hypothetical protein